MTLTVASQTGDGYTADFYDVDVTLPDSGTAVAITGRVQVVGGASTPITGTPLAMPSAPVSGSTFWNIQIDATSGAATVQQSPTADPAPINSNNRVVFRQTLTTTSTDPATTPESTPDTW